MLVRIPPYEIRPYKAGGGCCLHLFKWQEPGRVISRGMHKGRLTKAKWKDLDYYPSDLTHAFENIIERMIRDGDEVLDLQRAKIEWERIRQDILDGVQVILEQAHERA